MKPEQKVVKLALVTSELMRRLQLRSQEKQASTDQLGKLIPVAVKALVDNGRIYPNQAEKVAEALRDQVQTVQLLGAVAKHRNGSEAAIGTPTKTASEKPATSNRTPGAPIADYGETDAGKRFEQRILGQ
jgi:hypothetical protein